MAKHALRRTSPKGKSFIGVCVKCGTADLPSRAVMEDCPNQRGITEEEALLEAIVPKNN